MGAYIHGLLTLYFLWVLIILLPDTYHSMVTLRLCMWNNFFEYIFASWYLIAEIMKSSASRYSVYDIVRIFVLASWK